MAGPRHSSSEPVQFSEPGCLSSQPTVAIAGADAAARRKYSSVRARLLSVIDNRDFDGCPLRFQLESQLGRERIEHARAGVFAWKSINGAAQAESLVYSDNICMVAWKPEPFLLEPDGAYPSPVAAGSRADGD